MGGGGGAMSFSCKTQLSLVVWFGSVELWLTCGFDNNNNSALS